MKRIVWSAPVEQILSPALPGGAMKKVRREVERGQANLHSLAMGELFVVTRYEQSARELVIVAAGGRNLAAHVQTLYDYARLVGVPAIRFHTKHPSRLAKGLAGWPVYLVKKPGLFGGEYVYKMAVF